MLRWLSWGGVIVCLLFAWSGPARADSATLHAVRATSPIHVDGKLDEPAWRDAPVYSDFVESYPVVGGKPSQRTEARVLYDGSTLYVGVTCFDDHPELIQRGLGRRDSPPTSDMVVVVVDSQLDHRTGLEFVVNASGVQSDAIIYDDTNETNSWNAVWDAAAAPLPDGWSAEFAIPLHLLRFNAQRDQVWGIDIRRKIVRTHEDIDVKPIPRSANGFVSLMGRLVGLQDLSPQKDLELTPYVATRLSVQPRYLADDRPSPRLVNPAADVGLNLKASLGRSMTLNAAINPDFGEIEPDALQLNLSSYELFYPEMRPFFTEGLELFNTTVVNWSDQRMFYSRRIGLTAPLLGAVKLTGSVRDGLSMSVLDALVAGAADPAKQPYAYGDNADPDQAPLDRRLQFHWQTPFHFGLNNELPAERPVTTNYLALAARQDLGGGSSVGFTGTSAAPLSSRCTRADFASEADYLGADCLAMGGNAAALDWNLRSHSGDYAVVGQVSGSEVTGGAPTGMTRDDGTVLRAGDLGLGGFVRLGKLGGEPWQFDAAYTYQSPSLDLNPSGFQANSNQQKVDENLRFTRPNGNATFHSYSAYVNASQSWSADARRVPRMARVDVGGSLTFSNYLNVWLELGYERPQYDIREVGTTGIPFERAGDTYLSTWGSTDSSKPLQTGWNLVGFTLNDSPNNGRWGYHLDGWGDLRITDNLESYIELGVHQNPQGPRYIDTLADGHYVFAPQNPTYGSLTFRQTWVITPTLTLQAYAQLFTASAHYGPYYQGSPGADGKIRLSSLQPYAYAGDNPDFQTSALNVNVVGRWEYRPGSTLFLVYGRAQTAFPVDPDQVAQTFLPRNLGRGRTSDTFLVKWSYYWDA